MTRSILAPTVAAAVIALVPASASARSGFSFGFSTGPAFHPVHYHPAPIIVAPPPPVVVVRRPVCAYPIPVHHHRPYYGNSFSFSYFGR